MFYKSFYFQGCIFFTCLNFHMNVFYGYYFDVCTLFTRLNFSRVFIFYCFYLEHKNNRNSHQNIHNNYFGLIAPLSILLMKGYYYINGLIKHPQTCILKNPKQKNSLRQSRAAAFSKD